MKAFEEYRSKRIQEWNNQKKRRLELRNGLYCNKFLFWNLKVRLSYTMLNSFSAIDTDELDSDSKNVEEEVIEFFVKEETFIIDEK